MKFFIIFGVFIPCFMLVTSAPSNQDDEDIECTPGVSYIENRCNSCFCVGTVLACTAMACPSHHDPKLSDCEVGTKWNEGCEKCWCTKTWGTVCTVDCGEKQS